MDKKYYIVKNHPEYGIFDSKELGAALGNQDSIIAFTVEELVALLDGNKTNKKSESVKNASTETAPDSALSEYAAYDYVIFSDGGTTGSGGPGGYGAVTINCKTGEINELMKGFKSTTNNRMELMATIDGLNSVPDNTKIIVIADSQYVVKHLDGSGWSRNNNNDLWIKADDAIAKKAKVDFKHEYGHGKGNTFESKWNNRCDELSNIARETLELLTDDGYVK